ncbi:MAG: L-2-hydroxyglutarate oxidase [Alphaproteobacteria bacterium]|mgnify:CR=1 FL=1|nr:L-2-hydroxyglutarate oxidase [Alphaproteobacteria bacterium]MAS47688.1 L-2-hydroxyglutarate oxidase [Alphaproteobacteria bacterium]MAX96440.1 L-2-hydroxyglutarate oxidase [Alphaproteobacteria bacterium]MBN52005.1 L-2-hydroxyglutarate oxidase [Alphaproteobacteria bacterium]OUT40834.1 MAG: hydroxyglutarate oxidase [Micavibrio sp. TMED2]|tara:strand:+ start:9770 stop:10981 length:1212 start_codon:yes stop_codon:yes gene_type:complete
MKQVYDVIIIGGGIVGLATALELQNRNPDAAIAVLEKEPKLASHQSGHNSGVIHAGVYYAPGSLKARFCREGVAATTAFCDEHAIPYSICGKLIVATDEAEATRLDALHDRASQNGIRIEPVSGDELHRLEPHIAGVKALHSPTTGIVDYGRVARKMGEVFAAKGGTIITGITVLSGRESENGVVIDTDQGRFEAAHAVACAGLHSDRLIRAFGHEPDYRIVPFRGEYYRVQNQPTDFVRHLIYPVPDPERPFLGVHLTRKLDGGFTVGPNAVLAFKREGYRFRDISLTDLASTLGYGGFWRMLAANAGPALTELTASASKRLYLQKVQKYCASIRLADLTRYPAGVRAQAVARDGRIIDDFLFVKTARMLHVGNAPSPAATSAIPIAGYIADKLLQGRNNQR